MSVEPMKGFIPHTPAETEQMLKSIGLDKLENLFDDIPKEIRGIPQCQSLEQEGLDELSLSQKFAEYGQQNMGSHMPSFQGGGAYHRFIPPAVNAIASRSEFYTAYTPYQPEISQGTLQMIYEFQTMMSELTGLAVTNASVYDGANAVCETAFMAARITKRDVVYVSKTINPYSLKALQTYAGFNGDIQVKIFDPSSDLNIEIAEPDKVAVLIFQNPDYFGSLNDLSHVNQFTQQHGILFGLSVETFSLAVLQAPAAWGVDIVCGDIQPFGNPLNFGGPYGGFLSTKQAYVRQLPGRLVSQSKDVEGTTVYTLALQTREQHIRRAKATSNICTNQSLNVLKASVYLALVGLKGLKQLNTVSAERAHELLGELLKLSGVTERVPNQLFLNEFALKLPIPAKQLIATMARQHGIIAGIDVGKFYETESHTLLVAVTEMNTPHQIKSYLSAFKEALYHVEPANITPLNPVVQLSQPACQQR